MVSFSVLGPLLVLRDGVEVSLRAQKVRTLLAVLLCRAGRPVPVPMIMDALWGDGPPPTAAKTLQVYVHRLRQALGDPSLVRHDAGSYRLVAERHDVDAITFEALVGRARATRQTGDLRHARSLLAEALSMWRGAAYSGVAETTALIADEVHRLSEQRLLAVEERIAIDLELGAHAEVIAELMALAVDHPYREVVRAHLMLALYRSGRRVEALEVYRTTSALFADELGIQPSPFLSRLHQALLVADPDLELDHGERVTVLPAELPPTTSTFVGRAGEVDRILDALRSHPPGALPVVGISGPAGIGKTTLALHVSHAVRALYPEGQLYANLRGAGPYPLSAAEVVGRFLRALGVDAPALPADLEDRVALYRSKIADRRVLVLLDNASDEDQVRQLLPGTGAAAVLITSRRTLGGIEASLLLELDGLGDGESLELFTRIAGRDRTSAEPAQATEIVRICAGLPLAIRIAAGRARQGRTRTLRRLASGLRDERTRLDLLVIGDLNVRTSLSWSYQALDERQRLAFKLLGLLDVPRFAPWVPAVMLGIPHAEAEEVLEQLVEAGLLSAEADRFHFHDLVQLYARERAELEHSAQERDAAVGRAIGGWLWLAEAAARRIPQDITAPIDRSAPDPVLTEDLVADPVAWFDLEHEALAAAAAQAGRHGFTTPAWALPAAAINYFPLRGLYEDWLTGHFLAVDVCARAGDRYGEAVLRRNLGFLRLMGVKEPARKVLPDPMETLRVFQIEGDRYGEADMLYLGALLYRFRGDFESSAAVGDLALDIADTIGYELGKVRVWHLRAVLSRERGDHAAATRYAERCLDVAERIGAIHGQVLALRELVIVNPTEPLRGRLRTAMTAGRDRGDRLLEAYLRLFVTDLDLAEGRPADRSAVAAAISVFAERSIGFGHALGLRVLGRIAQAEADHATAGHHFAAAATLFRTLKEPYELAVTLRDHARSSLAAGDPDAATHASAEADQILRRFDGLSSLSP